MKSSTKPRIHVETIYFVGCRDCHAVRDLHKFPELSWNSITREEAIHLADALKSERSSFQAALLVSFMARHSGHNVTTFCEHDYKICEEFKVVG